MHSITLPDGNKMPVIGLGTFLGSPEEVELAVEAALEAGYRHIDTAYMYSNEEAIGRALKKWIDEGKGTREELYIVTKLPLIGNREDLVEHFLRLSLKKLQLEYVDLFLVHYPVGFKYIGDDDIIPKGEDDKVMLDMETDIIKVWKAMESLVDLNLTKSIGISNFSIEQQKRILDAANIKPANHQMEMNAFFRQKLLVEECRKNDISMVAYGPLGSPGRTELFEKTGQRMELMQSIMSDPIVKKVAEKHKKTPAQVLLRHLMQMNIAVIPKSTNKQRISDNIQIFDFELDETDLKDLDSLDKGEEGRSFFLDGNLPGSSKHPEHTY